MTLAGVLLWLTFLASPVAGNVLPVYTEVAAELGLDFTHTHGGSGALFYVETVGSGGGFIDHDTDGDLDIYLINGSPLPDSAAIGSTTIGLAPMNRLFRNDGNGFVDVTAAAGVGDTSYGMGLAVADFDNDGDSDLFVTNFGVNRLFENDAGVFHDVTDAADVGDSLWGTSASWLDYDNDGSLDLYVANYVDWRLADHEDCFDRGHRVYCDPGRYDAAPDRLYHNEGAGNFRETSSTAMLTPVRPGKGLGVATADIDHDGDQEIYVANDETPNLLLINDGGRFREAALVAGVSHNGGGEVEAGMGADFADYDGDGWADLFVTNFSYETYTLYRGLGREFFQDVTTGAGLVRPTLLPLGFGTRFLDFDNDGDVDLYCANGHVLHNIEEIERSLTYPMSNQLLRNDDGYFVDISSQVGEDLRVAVSRGLASADYDSDGDVDLLVTNNNGPVSLLRNDGGNRGHWLSVRLQGQGANRDGIGARVVLWTGGKRLVRERTSGGSYLASHDPRVHFGLGQDVVPDSLRVYWPDGSTSLMRTPPADQEIHVRQSSKP